MADTSEYQVPVTLVIRAHSADDANETARLIIRMLIDTSLLSDADSLVVAGSHQMVTEEARRA